MINEKWMQKLAPSRINHHYLSLIARILIALAALSLVFWNQNWKELKTTFQGLNLGIFGLSLAVYVIGQSLLAIRWWLLLKAQSISLKIITTIHLHFLGLFYNNIMPSSIGGDFLRAWYVSKHTHKKIEAALSVFVDRAVGLLSILLMALLSYLLFMQELTPIKSTSLKPTPDNSGTSTSLVIIGAVATTVVLLFLIVFGPSRQFLTKQYKHVQDILISMLAKLREALLVYWKRPFALVQILSLTLFLQSGTILAFFILGKHIGIEASVKHYFIIFPLMWVVGAVPITPAGLGILEGGIVFLFMRYTQATHGQATCLALCQRFIWVLSSLPGAAIHIFGSHLPKGMPNSFSFDAQENDD